MNKPVSNFVVDGFAPITVKARPRFEGCNINTWIGFKHVCYLLEEALIDAWRAAGVLPRALYEDHALCFEIVRSDTRILHALHMDDEVEIDVRRTDVGADPEATFALTAFVKRNGQRLKACVSEMSVQLRAEKRESDGALPPSLRNAVCDAVIRGEQASFPADRARRLDPSAGRGASALDTAIAAGIVAAGANAFAWLWRIPYFYCYYNERLRHSGYLRLMEEVEDLFLEARGISIKSMVDDKRLIPVVSHAMVSMVSEAMMEEPILIVYTINEIFKGFTYQSSMDCYVERDGRFVLVQRGSITHGYARMLDRRDWKLEAFDAPTLAAIQNAA